MLQKCISFYGLGKDESVDMDNAIQNNLFENFEVDNASYQDVMDEELVDNLESAVTAEKHLNSSDVSDDLLRTLLSRFQKKRIMSDSAVDTFEDEVMDEVEDASIKYD